MSIERKKYFRTKKRALRVRGKLGTSANLPKVTVFRSLKHIYAQVIDMVEGVTVASCSTMEMKDLKGSKKEVALLIGKELAKRATDKGISAVVFDRGQYLYHGRVKELAQGLRDGGLKV
jgi:large subunit ribosomal protein L18